MSDDYWKGRRALLIQRGSITEAEADFLDATMAWLAGTREDDPPLMLVPRLKATIPLPPSYSDWWQEGPATPAQDDPRELAAMAIHLASIYRVSGVGGRFAEYSAALEKIAALLLALPRP